MAFKSWHEGPDSRKVMRLQAEEPSISNLIIYMEGVYFIKDRNVANSES